MTRLILHRAFGSPPSRAALMLSDMIGLKPEIREVNLLKMEHRTPEFLKLNPICAVPVLEDDDFVLAESNAIMKYLLEKYGGDNCEMLYPSELRTRALVDQAMFFNVGVFFAGLADITATALFSNKTMIGPSPAHIQHIEASYSVLEAYLQNKRYVAADYLTLADLSNGSTATAIQVMLKVDPDNTKWHPNCTERTDKLDGSPPACAVRMLADIIGLPLDLYDSDWRSMEHKSPEYVKKNPLGTIPTLEDDDFLLSDSHAIMIYLVSKYGGDKSEQLYPSDLRTRAAVNQIMFFDTGIFFIRLKVVGLPTLLEGLKGPSEKHLADIEEAYGFVEAYLSKNKYIACDHLTIADLSVGATAAAMQGILKLDVDKFPRTAQWLALLEKESFFQKITTPGAEILAKTLQFNWQKNNEQ